MPDDIRVNTEFLRHQWLVALVLTVVTLTALSGFTAWAFWAGGEG